MRPIPLVAAALVLALSLSLSAQAADLPGKVIDERGRPIAGAEVQILLWKLWRSALDGPRYPFAVATGADGRFLLPGLPGGTGYDLRVTAEGHAPEAIKGWLPRAGSAPLLRLSLRRGRTLTGRVVDGTGQPVAEARIELLRTLQQERSAFDDGLYRATTGADGRFAVPHCPLSWVDLTIRAPGFLSRVVSSRAVPRGIGPADLGSFPLAPGTERGADPAGPGMDAHRVSRYLDPGRERTGSETDSTSLGKSIPLPIPDEEPGRKARGRVVGRGGRPIAGAQVRSYSRNGGRTLDDGSFEIPLVEFPEKITAVAEGYAEMELSLPAGRKDLSGLTVRLRPAGAVAGYVKGLFAEDQRRAFVFAYRGEPNPGHPANLDLSSGYYRIEGLSPGVWTIRAEGEHQKVEARVKVSPGRDAQLDLTLPALDWIPLRGRVEDPAGQPIAGVKLATYNGSDRIYAESGKDGRFEIAVARGPHQISVHHPDYLRVAQVEMEAKGAPLAELALVLTPGVRVHGRVLGVPAVPGEQSQSVEVETLGATAGYVDADSEGRYRTEALSPGEWWLIAAYGPRYQPGGTVQVKVTVPEAPGELEVDLVFPGAKGRPEEKEGKDGISSPP